MIQSEEESVRCFTERENEHLEASLPGTPMDGDVSTDVLLSNSLFFPLIIAKAQVIKLSDHTTCT